MTIAFWCLMIAAILPLTMAWVAGYFRHQQFGVVDNKLPRAQCSQLTGAGARAVAAQQNSWEALAVFSAAVLVSHLGGADPERAGLAAIIFIAARVLYVLCYLADKDLLRSLSFIAGFGCCIWLFLMPV